MISTEPWYVQAVSPAREVAEAIETLRRNPEDESIVHRLMGLWERVFGLSSKGPGSLFSYLSDPAMRSILTRIGWNDYAVEPRPGDIANGIYELVLKQANESNDPDWVALTWEMWQSLTKSMDEWPELTSKAARKTPDKWTVKGRVLDELDLVDPEWGPTGHWVEQASRGREGPVAELLKTLIEGAFEWHGGIQAFVHVDPGVDEDEEFGSIVDERTVIEIETGDVNRIKDWVANP